MTSFDLHQSVGQTEPRAEQKVQKQNQETFCSRDTKYFSWVWKFSFMFAAKLLTQLWLTSDHAAATLAAAAAASPPPPPRPATDWSVSRARCLLFTPRLITLIISTSLSIWMSALVCPIFARSLQRAVRRTAFRRRSWQRWSRREETCQPDAD